MLSDGEQKMKSSVEEEKKPVEILYVNATIPLIIINQKPLNDHIPRKTGRKTKTKAKSV